MTSQAVKMLITAICVMALWDVLCMSTSVSTVLEYGFNVVTNVELQRKSPPSYKCFIVKNSPHFTLKSILEIKLMLGNS